jgi:hypothetical protein
MAPDVSVHLEDTAVFSMDAKTDTAIDTSVMDGLIRTALELAALYPDSSPADAIRFAIKHGPETCTRVLPVAIKQLQEYKNPPASPAHSSPTFDEPDPKLLMEKLDRLMENIGESVLVEQAKKAGKPVEVCRDELRARLLQGLRMSQ